MMSVSCWYVGFGVVLSLCLCGCYSCVYCVRRYGCIVSGVVSVLLFTRASEVVVDGGVRVALVVVVGVISVVVGVCCCGWL